MMRRRAASGVLALLCLVLAAACGSNSESGGGSGGSDSKTTTLNVGLFGALSDAGLITAQKKGYFTAERLDVKFVPSQSAPTIISLTAAGKLDASGTSATPGLFNAISRGVKLKIAADKGKIDPTHSWTGLVVRQDLFGSGAITSVAQLKGKRIGVPDVNTATGAELAKALESAGLSIKDVKLVPQNPADSFAALQSKSVDAAALQEPFIAQATAKKVGHVLLPFGTVMPGAANGIILYGEKLATNKDLSARFLKAYLKGVADYNAAFPTDGKKPVGRDEIVSYLVAATSVKSPELYEKMAPVLLAPDGKVDMASIDAFQQFFKSIGSQQTIVPSSEYLLDAAK
ncbi:ABC transporter substrate-binding protein [Actinomadura sp. HBU206391]|uniref:ABC transporter substrate-binding protein n=1 Tax=Actinomadura sp. HBU206391 TaxID=2731692 RepID=UPI00164FB421|nr:ABC transporter substrate-binding protein [Actinomadura sp. HBU206391]MBC6463618.1 ABC transporter substrate-binding protein [Actinomadura sp. HBU206391]